MADERDSSATLVEAAPVATGAAKHQIVLGGDKGRAGVAQRPARTSRRGRHGTRRKRGRKKGDE
jgi:hypothetical protein